MGAALLGQVQGLTEFLPVSSSGHLVLVRALLHWQSSGASLEVWLHAATLVSVLVALRFQMAALFRGLWRRERSSMRLLLAIIVGTLPAATAGFFLRPFVPGLFQLPVAAVGFLLTSLLLFTAPGGSRDGGRELADLTALDALIIGGMQACALLPGLSRSASTMAAARWCGLSPRAAAEFSFLLAMPVIAGAFVLTGVPAPPMATAVLIGALTAGTAGVLAVQWAMRGIVKPQWWRGFGIYTLVMAILAWGIGR